MRTTFFEMHLLNDTSQMHDTSFIQNRKEWGESKIEGEGRQVKNDSRTIAEKGLWRG
jgi:hypothetical protein